MKFVVKGEPFPLSRNKSMSSSLWDHMKDKKIYYRVTLENQLGQHSPFSGPLNMELIFYLAPKKRQVDMSPVLKPDLSALVCFIERIAQGILYKKSCTIANLHAKKLYDTNPRTEIIITERVK